MLIFDDFVRVDKNGNPVKDLQIVAGCFEKATEVSMKDFVDAFDKLLTREQIRYLISKMEDDFLILKEGSGRWTKYFVNQRIDVTQNIFVQFSKILNFNSP